MPYTQDHRSSIETNSTGGGKSARIPQRDNILKNFKNISENFAKTAPSIRDISKGENTPPPAVREGGAKTHGADAVPEGNRSA